MSTAEASASSERASADTGVLAVAEVADRLGVSVSTLRSWERRYGLAATARTHGGHRRYSYDDLLVLQRVRRLIDGGLATGAAINLAQSTPHFHRSAAARSVVTDDQLATAFTRAVDQLDSLAATTAAHALVSRHGVTAAWIDTFVPYLRDIGRTWQRTGTAIECEHLAVDAVRAALNTHREDHGTGDPADAALVVLAATEQERHTLPLYALEAALLESGTPARAFGHLPPSTLRSVVEQLKPREIVLWARCRHDDDIDQLRAVRRYGDTVHAAGPGWTRSRLPRGTSHLADLPAALRTLAGNRALR